VSISEPFIRRPVATTLLTVGLLLAGLIGYRQLPVSALPQVDYPTILVSTLLPGASAETMASAVTTPLERQFGQVPALAQMTSVSSFGTSQITLQFELDRSIDAAEQDVQAAIKRRFQPAPPHAAGAADVLEEQPGGRAHPHPGRLLEDPAAGPGQRRADSILAQKISQVFGVGLVTINGAQKPAIRVQVDPVALAGTGLTLEDVRAAVAASNVNQPRATSTVPGRTSCSRPTTSWSGRLRSAPWSSPTRMGRPCVSTTWPTLTRASRTTSSPAGRTGTAPSSSTCSASPART